MCPAGFSNYPTVELIYSMVVFKLKSRIDGQSFSPYISFYEIQEYLYCLISTP
jgi:hypothetical protein